tara:strand:+ start:1905 stop:2114 length:210 start_codon:yes stop_codon:yes gene_type:complete
MVKKYVLTIPDELEKQLVEFSKRTNMEKKDLMLQGIGRYVFWFFDDRIKTLGLRYRGKKQIWQEKYQKQ